MTPHCKIYFDYFGYGEQDVILCEVCEAKAVDIHHIRGRGKGRDVIGNLMGLCRYHHRCAHGLENTYLHKDVLQVLHDKVVDNFSGGGVSNR